jgi:hypothetical protein
MQQYQEGFCESCDCYVEYNSYCPLCVDQQSQLLKKINYCPLCLDEQNKSEKTNKLVTFQDHQNKNRLPFIKEYEKLAKSDNCALCIDKQKQSQDKKLLKNAQRKPKITDKSKDPTKPLDVKTSLLKNIPIDKMKIKRDKPKISLLNFEKLTIKRFKDDEITQEHPETNINSPEKIKEDNPIQELLPSINAMEPKTKKKIEKSIPARTQEKGKKLMYKIVPEKINARDDFSKPVETKQKKIMYKIVPNKNDLNDELSDSIISFENLSTHRSLISSEPSLIELNRKTSKAVGTEYTPLVLRTQQPIIVLKKPQVLYAVPPAPISLKSSLKSQPIIALKNKSMSAPGAAKNIWNIKYVRNELYNKLN